MSTPLRFPPSVLRTQTVDGEPRSVRARPVVLSRDRIARGLELARRDSRTALRVAVVAHGRILSALDRRTRGLMWHGCRPRRFLTVGLSRRHTREQLADHSKIAAELATWWHAHADELSPDWPSRLLATIQAVALDRWHFPQLSTVSWTTVTGVDFAWQAGSDGQLNRRSDLPGWVSERPGDRSRYLAQLRDFRADLLDKAARIEKTAQKVNALRAAICADDLNRGDVSRFMVAAADAADKNRDVARELRTLASLVAIHGPAGKDAESAARGSFARVLSLALDPVPLRLQTRFVALLLDDLNFGTSDTYRGVQSILRARRERGSK